jgi:hypothetical protein
VLEAEWRLLLGMFSEGWRISVVGEGWRAAVEIKRRSMAASSTAILPVPKHLCQ